MMAAINEYLALRRGAGFVLSNAQYLLGSFAAFAADRQQPYIRTATVIDWASRAPSSAQRHTRYQTVRQFAQHVHLEDPRHDLPPPNHFGSSKTRRVPRIYTVAEIDRLILAATQLSEGDNLRAQTYATLISLLAATGLRISEALHLRYGDVTPDGLLIRKTKFQKTRLVPLHETATTRCSPTTTVSHSSIGPCTGSSASSRCLPAWRQCAGIARGCTSSGTRLPRVRCSQRLRAANGSDSTCWHWPPISAT
jgi:integrase